LAETSDPAEAVELTRLDTPRSQPVLLIETKEELQSIANRLAGLTGPLAIDAERASGFKYSQRAYLVQIHKTGGPIYLLDPVSISPTGNPEDFSSLQEAIVSDEWILHAATQDLPCLAALGLKPAKLFDTELASRLAGLERVGLGAACEALLGLKLAKEHSAVDWSTRPLHDDWLNYAALDVDVLIELRAALIESLSAQNKLDFALEEFEALTKFQPKPAKVDKWRSTTGINEIRDPRGMSVVRALWNAREALAEKLDVSPGRLIPDLSIVAAAKVQPKTKPELISLKAFNGRASRTYLDTWFAAIEAGMVDRELPVMRLATQGIPNHRIWPSKYPAADARLQKFRSVVAEVSEELNIPIENLLTPDTLRQLAWNVEISSLESISEFLRSLKARDWQTKLLAQRFCSTLLEDEREAL
jgi:ribonuclease D